MSVSLSATSVNNKTHQPAPVAERYGMLKVLMFVPKKGWLVKCDCGVEKYVEGNPLRNNRHLSCGCNAKARQANTLRKTLSKKVKPPTVVLKPIKHATTGVRCWVCRNKTGIDAEVALCRICVRGCV